MASRWQAFAFSNNSASDFRDASIAFHHLRREAVVAQMYSYQQGKTRGSTTRTSILYGSCLCIPEVLGQNLSWRERVCFETIPPASDVPRLSHRSAAHSIGLFIAGEFFLHRIKRQFATELPSNVRSVADDVRLSDHFRVGIGQFASFHAVQKSYECASSGRCQLG